jgi:hypothetical protein
MDFIANAFRSFEPALNGFIDLWWFWLFLVLVWIARAFWLAYCQAWFKATDIDPNWVMLEIRLPREIEKTPRAMDQVFMTMHGMRNSPTNFKEMWWDGEVTRWFSLEVVSFSGDIHFYIRLHKSYRNAVESSFYAHYPDIELHEVKEDYIYRLPPTFAELHSQGYELFGNEFVLAKADAFPIHTYEQFEKPEDEQKLDPVAALLELLAKCRPRESIWLQILIRPTDDSWKKRGEEIMKELKEKFGRRQIATPLGEFVMLDRSPGEIEIMKAVDHNLDKPGFETLIREIYIAPKEIYSDGFARRGVLAAFNQYGSELLNKFVNNFKAWTRVQVWYKPYIFPKIRQRTRQERLYKNYRERRLYAETRTGSILDFKIFHWGFGARKLAHMGEKTPLAHMVLNTEELATLFHPPTAVVLVGPLVKREQARKIGPPAGLPIYGAAGEEKLPGL